MREKHNEKQWVEPSFEWGRICSPGNTRIPKGLKMELNPELETDGDLIEPIPQLLCDSNVVAETAQERVGHEQSKLLLDVRKRMEAMMTQITIENDKVLEQMLHLKRRMRSLTWGIFFLGIVTIGFMFFSYVQLSLERISDSLSFFSELFHSVF